MDNLESLIVEHLRNPGTKVNRPTDDLREGKLRMSSLESQFTSLHTDMTLIHHRINGAEARLGRQRAPAGSKRRTLTPRRAGFVVRWVRDLLLSLHQGIG